MPRLSAADILGLLGIASGFVLVVLDKAGKLRGSLLLFLLALAAALTLPALLNFSWVHDAQGLAKFSRVLLAVCLVGAIYSLLAVWVSPDTRKHGAPKDSSQESKVNEKLDAITKILEAQGDAFSQKELLKKYPLGYIIFEVNYQNSVFPYDRQLLEQYDLDWSVVGFTKITEESYDLRLPDMQRRGYPTTIKNVHISGRKQASKYANGVALGELMMLSQIIAVRETGIVFLVGFGRSIELPKR